MWLAANEISAVKLCLEKNLAWVSGILKEVTSLLREEKDPETLREMNPWAHFYQNTRQ